MRSKTCLIIPSLSSGGIEMYVLRFLNYIKSKDQITIIVRSNQKGELYEDYKKTGVELVFMPLGYLNLIKAVKYYLFFKKISPKVVCDFNANFAGISLFLAKLAGVNKRVAFYRQGSNHFKPSLAKNFINKLHNFLVYKYATNILANSKAALEYFFSYRKSNDQRFKVVYNGVDSSLFELSESKEEIREELGIPKNAFVVGHVGRLDSSKNHGTILKVIQNLIKIDDTFYLVLCGRNTETLNNLIQQLSLQSYVKILGYRVDVARVLKSFDLFFFPSITEGQPNALIEAMLARVKFVASNIPSIKETVPEDTFSLLYRPNDCDSFTKKIIDLKKEILDVEEIKKYAELKFNANNNFKTFDNILKND